MSSHALLRVGEEVDLYYTDEKNCSKQSIPVEYNTRFRSEFSNKGTGVSVFTIPPGNGLRHILIVIGYSAADLAGNTGAVALPRGWGYRALSQVSFRIAGSSQYFMSGAQLLARNLRLCRTREQRQAILNLGGAECKAVADFAVDQYAYIPVSVFAAPSADGISLPIPGDLLNQQIMITAEVAPTTDFWITNPTPGTLTGVPPAMFTKAYFQAEQLIMEDRGMSLAARANLDTHSYNMPLPDFDQQEVLLQIPAGGGSSPLVLTGFRSGQVKKLQIYLTKNSVSGGYNGVYDAGRWFKPAAVEVMYAGQVFAKYDEGSSAMWNLLDGTAPSIVDQSILVPPAPPAPGQPGTWSSGVQISEWVELPFAQPTGNDYDGEVLVNGKLITNGIVNLNVTPPTADAYTCHVVYVYNCTASFSRGGCELVW